MKQTVTNNLLCEIPITNEKANPGRDYLIESKAKMGFI